MELYQLKPEHLSFLTHPLYEKMANFKHHNDAGFRATMRNPYNQLHFMLVAYARFEALTIAFERSFVTDRDMSTLVPKRLRATALSDLRDDGLIEQMPSKENAWSLTAEGRTLVRAFKDVF